jgi:uncharacterized delta-60 repeat protein
LQDVSDVRLRSVLADDEFRGDLLIRETSGNKSEYLSLPRCKLAGVGLDFSGRGSPGELLTEAAGDGRGEHGAAVSGHADCRDQLGRVLEQEAARSRPQRLVDVLVEVERRRTTPGQPACTTRELFRLSSVQQSMKSRLALAALAVLIQSWILPPSGWAAPGDLDLSFGGNGKVATNFTSGDDMAFGVAIQSDGRIVAVGSADFQNEFALARYTPDGSLDASFDGDGKLTTTFTGDHDSAHDLAIQADGKIVAAGTAGFDSYALARYESDGSLDPSFGEDGKVLTNLTGGFDVAYAVAIQANGKIVVAGRSAGAGGRFALARYESDGSLDPSFSGDGKVLTNFTSRDDYARDVAIQADGKIVVAGSAGGVGGRFALARYESDGSLDPSFSGDGKVLTNFTRGMDLALGIAIQSNRRIVAAGHAGGTRASPRNHKFAIARYRANGALDRSFSSDGKRVVNFTSGDDWAQDVAIQPDGKIVAAGRAAGAGGRFALARFWAT